MSKHPHSRPPARAMEEAVDWFVSRDARAQTVDEQAAFEAWLASDPAHGPAYEEITRLWSDLGQIPTVRTEQAGTSSRKRPRRMDHDRARRRRPRRWAAAAIAAGVFLFAIFGADIPLRIQADAISGVGETRTVTLSDGSSVTLNTNSAIAVDYAPDERRVRLLRGEAVFTVAKKAGRPFRVVTEGGYSTALGTVFLVRRQSDGATVTVLESRVAVTAEGKAIDEGRPSGSGAVLAPGQQVAYASGSGLGPVRAVDAQAAGAWRRGKLIFVDRPLGEVIAG